MYLFVEGDKTPSPFAAPPQKSKVSYTVYHEVTLRPGEQYALKPDTLRWFQGGPQGAVVSEFSTASHDDSDIFSDPRIFR